MKKLFYFNDKSEMTYGAKNGLDNYDNIYGCCQLITGDAVGLRGEVTGLSGDIRNCSGDCTYFIGDCTGKTIFFDEIELSEEEKEEGKNVADV